MTGSDTASEPEDTLVLPAAMRAEIVAHARVEVPRECCGAIVGEAGRPTTLHRLTNRYPGNDFYEVDPSELYRLWRDLEDRGQDILAIYHSHPVSPAYPSPRDVDHAGWPDACYLICSLADPANPVLRGFRIVDGEITEVQLL